MEKKKLLNSPFSPNGVDHPGQSDWDTDYLSIEIVDKVRKIGDGDEDYVIEKKVIETRTPIKEIVDADKDNVGVYPILKQFAMTGDDSLIPMEKDPSNVDLVGVPGSIMEMKQAGIDAEKAFNGLPSELVNGLDMQSFVESMTQEKFNEFINAVAARQSKSEVKGDE